MRKLFNLRSDPKEEYDVFWQSNEVATSIDQWITQFQATLEKEPPIKPGAPDSYRPAKKK